MKRIIFFLFAFAAAALLHATGTPLIVDDANGKVYTGNASITGVVNLGLVTTGNNTINTLITNGATQTGNRTLSLDIGDANRSVSIRGNISLSGGFNTTGGGTVNINATGNTTLAIAADRTALTGRGALYLDGSVSTVDIKAALGAAAALGADEKTINVVFRVPNAVTGSKTRSILTTTSSSGLGFVSGMYGLCFDAASAHVAIVRGDSGSNYRVIFVPNVITDYAGKVIHLIVSSNGSNAPNAWINGASVTPINPGSGGTAPAWNSSISTAYLRFGNRAATETYDGEIFVASLINGALAQADVSEIYERGGEMPMRFKRGSQVALTSGTLIVGQKYRINTFVSGDSFTNVGAASNASGVEFVATGTTPTTWTNASSLVAVGAVVHYNADLDGIGYQWHDQANAYDVIIPTTGTAWTKPALSGYVRGTLTWSASQTAQNLLGQRAFPAGVVVDTITYAPTASSSGSGLTIGTTNSATRWVAADTFTSGVKEVGTLANRLPGTAGDSYHDILVKPDTANFTGSISVEAAYHVTLGTP